MSRTLGIDIGGTNTAFAVVDETNEFTYSNSIKTKDFKDLKSLLQEIKSILEKNRQQFEKVGIGAPSVNQNTKQIEHAPNLDWDEIVPIKEIADAVFELDVVVINDANAAAVAEKYAGDAKDLDNFAVITLGTGIGCGLYINGELSFGDNGLAGELGQLIIHRDGRENKNGIHGCLETYVGSKGIIATAKEKLEFSSVGSLLQSLPPSEISPVEIFKFARKEDPVALEVADSVAEDLGYGISHLVNLMNINTIFLTGGIAKSGNILRRKTEKVLKYYVHPGAKENLQIKISQLVETNSGVLGAALTASIYEGSVWA